MANPVGTHSGPWLFEQALTCMKAGGAVRRTSWKLAVLKSGVVIRNGRIEFASIPGTGMAPSHEDILAEDWEMVST